MDVYELIKNTDAEIVANRATARIDGKFVVVAEVGETAMELTEAGAALAATLSAPKTRVARTKVDPIPETEE